MKIAGSEYGLTSEDFLGYWAPHISEPFDRLYSDEQFLELNPEPKDGHSKRSVSVEAENLALAGRSKKERAEAIRSRRDRERIVLRNDGTTKSQRRTTHSEIKKTRHAEMRSIGRMYKETGMAFEGLQLPEMGPRTDQLTTRITDSRDFLKGVIVGDIRAIDRAISDLKVQINRIRETSLRYSNSSCIVELLKGIRKLEVKIGALKCIREQLAKPAYFALKFARKRANKAKVKSRIHKGLSTRGKKVRRQKQTRLRQEEVMLYAQAAKNIKSHINNVVRSILR